MDIERYNAKGAPTILRHRGAVVVGASAMGAIALGVATVARILRSRSRASAHRAGSVEASPDASWRSITVCVYEAYITWSGD